MRAEPQQRTRGAALFIVGYAGGVTLFAAAMSHFVAMLGGA